MNENFDFRKLSTIGLILGGVATIAEIMSLPFHYVVGVGIIGTLVLGYAFIVRRRSKELPAIPKIQTNEIIVRPIETPAEFELDNLYHACFGASSVPTEVLKSWWNAYPKGLIGLLKNGQIVGGVSIWSIDDPTYDKLINGYIKEREIMYSNIDNNTCDRYYVSEIAIMKKERNIDNLSELLQGVIEHLMGSCCYPVSVLALGYSPEGIGLMQRFGFIKQLNADRTADKQPLFRLTVNKKEDMQTLILNLEKLQSDKMKKSK
jgi:hypothetical protein